jgi:hypothetical protein
MLVPHNVNLRGVALEFDILLLVEVTHRAELFRPAPGRKPQATTPAITKEKL